MNANDGDVAVVDTADTYSVRWTRFPLGKRNSFPINHLHYKLIRETTATTDPNVLYVWIFHTTASYIQKTDRITIRFNFVKVSKIIFYNAVEHDP